MKNLMKSLTPILMVVFGACAHEATQKTSNTKIAGNHVKDSIDAVRSADISLLEARLDSADAANPAATLEEEAKRMAAVKGFFAEAYTEFNKKHPETALDFQLNPTTGHRMQATTVKNGVVVPAR